MHGVVGLNLSPARRYMLQLLERPAYQRAFGAGTAEKLMTIVTLGCKKLQGMDIQFRIILQHPSELVWGPAVHFNQQIWSVTHADR